MSTTDLLKTIRTRFQAGIDADRDNRDRDLEDRTFYKGGKYQWDAAALRQRIGRPTVTINRLPQFVKQVTGDMRQNRPAIRVLPSDDKTDPQLAEVYSAIIRHIENLSGAQRVYSKAGEQAVIGGIAWFRVLTDYLDDSSFEQEIKIEGVRNPLAVVVDPAAKELTRHDMKWLVISELMPVDDFRAAYPDAALTGFDGANEFSEWFTTDSVRVAEYWEKVPVKRDLVLLSDGSTRFADELTEIDAAVLEQSGISVVRQRQVTTHKVRWHKVTGVEVLASGEWRGKYIPFIPVIGEETEVGDEVFRHGLIHHSKDSARSYNFARSAMTEHIASQPKSPYLATAEMVKNHKSAWEGLASSNPQVLLYDPDPRAPGGRPMREAPPTFASAWYQEAELADNDMKATTGIYDASLGRQGNETSGRAIMARDQQGETATYLYIDNQIAAIEQCGRILIDIIPHIYSDERVIRIIGEDDKIEGYARINARMPDGALFNDISAGQFDLVVTTGPAFATKRIEAADRLMALVQSVPQIGQVAGDAIVRALDIPGGDKIADRVAMALIPPGVDQEVDAKRMQAQAAMAQAMGPQQPPPEQAMAMASAEADVAKKQADAARSGAQAKQIEFQTAMQAMQAGVAVGMGDGP